MTNASTELATLWELLGKGTHEAWPEGIELVPENHKTNWTNQYRLRYKGPTEVDDTIILSFDHALAIVRDHIKRQLTEKEWSMERTERGTCYTPNDYTLRFHTLPDAVRYALDHQ